MSKRNMSNEVRAYLCQIGAKGGKAGRGKAKARGDLTYYARLAKRRWKVARARRQKSPGENA